MDDTKIGLRTQDIQTSLQRVDIKGLAAGKLKTTRLVGMAERFAIHIRGKDVVEYDEILEAMAAQIGIDSLVLPSVLEVLEDVSFIERRGNQIYDRVPYFTNLYEVMGQYWKANHPSEVEAVSVALLDDLAQAPVPEEEIRSKYSIAGEDFNIVKEIGDFGAYIRCYISPNDGAPVLYSPVFWEENPEALFEMLRKYSAQEIAEAIASIRNYQGYPIINLKGPAPTRKDQIILEAMSRGLLPAPSVDSTAGKRHFAFTPYSGGIALTPEERSVLDKARAILASIRYGQRFASVTRIRSPRRIIDKLEEKKKIGPHSEIRQQYFILWQKGIVKFAQDTVHSDRHWLHLVESEENMKALRLARDMLTVGESITERGLDNRARDILFRGTYDEPLTALAERRRDLPQSQADIKVLLDKITDDIREVF